MSGEPIKDIRTLNVGDTFTVKSGGVTRTMRVTKKSGDEVTAVWDPNEEERTHHNALGWQAAEEFGWL